MDCQERFLDAKNHALQLNETQPNTQETHVREHVLKQLCTSHVGDDIEVTNFIQTKTDFSHAMTVMDIVGGCHEKKRRTVYGGAPEDSDIDGRLAACIV